MKNDEFDWRAYPKHHAWLMKRSEGKVTQFLSGGDFDVVDERIIMREGVLPLGRQHKLLYETIMELKPKDVHEVGCGWGNHLANISILTNGAIDVYGSEISEKQIEIALTKCPWLNNRITLGSVMVDDIPERDIVFTITVLMHLSDINLEKAILNIASSAKKHIVMTENLDRRNYASIFSGINPEGWGGSKIKIIRRDGGNITVISKR